MTFLFHLNNYFTSHLCSSDFTNVAHRWRKIIIYQLFKKERNLIGQTRFLKHISSILLGKFLVFCTPEVKKKFSSKFCVNKHMYIPT